MSASFTGLTNTADIAGPVSYTHLNGDDAKRLNAEEGGVPRIYAVSYTHLDVYKRQGLRFPERFFDRKAAGNADHRHTGYDEHFPGDRLRIFRREMDDLSLIHI